MLYEVQQGVQQEFSIAITPKQIRCQANLVRACEFGELKIVKRLIRDGTNPNMLSQDRKHPFGAAIMGCNIEVVKFLDGILNVCPNYLRKILNLNIERYTVKLAPLIPTHSHLTPELIEDIISTHFSYCGFLLEDSFVRCKVSKDLRSQNQQSDILDEAINLINAWNQCKKEVDEFVKQRLAQQQKTIVLTTIEQN